MLARKKALRFINNKFTLNQQILALLLLMRKISQLQKKWQKIFLSILYILYLCKCKCGAGVESLTGSPKIAGSSLTCVVQFVQGMACQTEDYACGDFLGGFMSYLRNGWSVNLRAIENCIFSIRSIERNMTVYVPALVTCGFGDSLYQ